MNKESETKHACSVCNKEIKSIGLSCQYAVDKDHNKICYDCVAELDRQTMIDQGNSNHLPLYFDNDRMEVTNWPGTLRFPVTGARHGGHNIAGQRVDLWFWGPDGYQWHGVQYGTFTQIAHCKRTSTKQR